MTVGLVIVSHSTQLARGVAELAGQMARGTVPIAAAGGAGENILGTSADIIFEAIQAVDNPSGVLILLDMGSAILSAEMALEMLPDEQRPQRRMLLRARSDAVALRRDGGHEVTTLDQALAHRPADQQAPPVARMVLPGAGRRNRPRERLHLIHQL